MSREILRKGSSAELKMLTAAAPEDPYVSKLIKLIPADVISVYLTVFNLIKSNT